MLQTLKHWDSQATAAILAGLSLSLFPADDVNPESLGIDKQLRARLMEEVFQKLNLNPLDRSELTLARVYGFLAKEMGKAALSGADTKEIKKRIGQRGDLRPDLYEIKIPTGVRKEASARSIPLREIRDAIAHPSEVEHLLPEHFESTGDAVSLYSQEWEITESGEPLFLLVLTKRSGYTQTVLDALQIYRSDVNLYEVRTPLEILQAFLDVYGLPMRVGNEVKKFVLYEKIAAPVGVKRTSVIQVLEIPKKEVVITRFFGRRSLGGFEVALAYSIPDLKYRADLQRHK